MYYVHSAQSNSGWVQAECMQIRGSIERKAAYLHELQSQVLVAQK